MKVVLSLLIPLLPFSSHFVLTSPEAVLLFQQGGEFCTKCLTKVQTDTSDGLDNVGGLTLDFELGEGFELQFEFNFEYLQLVTLNFLTKVTS